MNSTASNVNVESKVEKQAASFDDRIAQISEFKVLNYTGEITHEITQE